MTDQKLISTEEYQKAQTETVYFIQEDNGYLALGDEGRLDFLNRQTTNDLTQLGPEKAITTVLTSSIGRILDVMQVINEGDTLGVITLPGHYKSTTDFLKGKIFFMDKVTIEDRSQNFVQIDLDGPQAGKALVELGVENLPEVDHIARTEIAGAKVTLIGQKGLAGEVGYRLIFPKSKSDTVSEKLEQDNISPISEEVRQVLRVEAGLPGAETEFTQDFNPLETDMAWAISGTKGCYPGQEVIARQINYDKITKKLVQLKTEDIAEMGAVVRVDGKKIGSITSTALSPDQGPLALAVLKRPHHEPGSKLEIDNEDKKIPAVVNF